MSQQQNLKNAKLSIGDAIVWNSRRIEKLEELAKNNKKIRRRKSKNIRFFSFARGEKQRKYAFWFRQRRKT